MDITPIFELRNQLRSAAIAGANLLSENFRLKKSVEAFEPLKAASPVFGKIYELSASLVSDSGGDRSGTLLDTITLVDSVVCTLASSAVPGTVEELPVTEFSAKITNAPYSELSALVDALTSSGSGKYEIVNKTRLDRPELLNDYRVKPALVKGLGASYSELADLVEKILEDMGKDIVPLLKKDFDPKGKKETVRRVNVIEAICGASENAFYLEQLEAAEKDVRKALVYALRHDESNIDKLIEFTKTEKGKAKSAALYALAALDCEKSAAFFEEYSKKKPAEAVKIMEDVSSKWSSELTARLIDDLLVDDKGNKITLSQSANTNSIKLKEKTSFPELNSALWGKWGEEVEKIYREFDNKDSSRPLSVRLGDAIIVTKDEGLKALAIELNNKSKLKGHYDYAEAVARFMSAEDCSDWLKKKVHELKQKSLTDPKAVNNSDLTRVLRMIAFKNGGYVLTTQRYSDITEQWRDISVPVLQPMKELTDIFIKYPNEFYHIAMSNWLDPNDREFCEKLGQYFVDEFTKINKIYLLNLIRKTGVKNVKGLAHSYFNQNATFTIYNMRSFFKMLPGDNDYKLAEAREIVDLCRNGKLRGKFNADEFSAWAETELKF